MRWRNWLGELGKTLARGSGPGGSGPGGSGPRGSGPRGSGPRDAGRREAGLPVGAGGTGEGEFARRLGGVTLRQFISGELGGSTEKVLGFQPDGQFVYHETSQYDGGFVRTEPEYGTWSAQGDFPAGRISLSWVGGGTTHHVIEYHGGDTCRFDGVTTMVR